MSLIEIQNRFARALRQPLGSQDRLNLTPEVEKAVSCLYQDSHGRLEIYAQQYWWRLFNTLFDHYPLLTALFGYDGFKEALAVPYLIKYPPTHWNINLLGVNLPDFLKESYFAEDKLLVIAAAELDASYILAFLGKQAPLPGSETETLYLTPTVFLFSWKWDLVPFRREILKQNPNYWVENDFPLLKKERTYFTLIRRTASGNIAADDLSEPEYRLLLQFRQGTSLRDLKLEEPSQTEMINRWIKQRVLTPEPLIHKGFYGST